MSSPESVSSRMAELRLHERELEDLVALLLAAGEADVHSPLEQRFVHVQYLDLVAHLCEEVHRVELGLPAMPAERVDRRLEEVGVVHAGDLDRVLEGEEHAFAGPLFRREVEQRVPFEEDLPSGHLVAVAARQHVRQRALARAVRAHDGVDFTRRDAEVDPGEDVLSIHRGAQILDFEHRSCS